MWIILGSAVACGLALWHLRVTVPNLVEPTVEEVGDAVLAIKPTYASLTTPTRTFVVAVTAAVCGAASVCAPPWAWGVWWIWSGSVTTLVIVDYATTFLPLKLWRRCVAEAGGSAPERNRPDAAATCTVAHCVCFDRGSVNRILLAHVAT